MASRVEASMRHVGACVGFAALLDRVFSGDMSKWTEAEINTCLGWVSNMARLSFSTEHSRKVLAVAYEKAPAGSRQPFIPFNHEEMSTRIFTAILSN